jgi:hypothetical protein
MMYPANDNSASCEILAIIRFLHAKNMSAVEIRRELCATVHGQNVIREEAVRKLCRIFKYDRANKSSR